MLIGRFAPSPTGPLHMGSLVTAVASFLDVKQRGGRWFVRIDDIDPPRESAEAKADILGALRDHGLTPDRAIDWQSTHLAAYDRALATLSRDCFYCTCSRATLRGRPIYPGTCRARTAPVKDAALRLRVGDGRIEFADRVLGPQVTDLASEVGDFIVRRRDGLVAYNLATAVDDGAAGVTSVLRGRDLLPVTAPQLAIMRRLQLDPPEYAHIPLLCYEDGTKLSKQTGAPPLASGRAADNVREALRYLGLSTPDRRQTAREWIAWALERWSLARVPGALLPYRAPA